MRNGEVYFTPLLEKNNFLIDFSSIPNSIATKAKVIWVNYPNSPTGVSAPREWLKILVAWAQHFNIIIAADEGCYNDIYFHKKPTSLLQIQKEGIITFYSLSKRSNMTGYRIGFVAGDSRIIAGFRKLKANIDSGTPTFIQDAAILALQDENKTIEMRKEYSIKRDIIISAFSSSGLKTTTSDATFYIWQKVPEHLDSLQFTKIFIDLGMIVVPGEIIADEVDGFNPGRNFIRLALVPNIEDINEAANRIKTIPTLLKKYKYI